MQLANAPHLVTDRLILRPPTQADLEGFYQFGQEEQTMRFLNGVKSRHEIWRGATSLMGSWIANGFGMFSVLERSSNRWVGRVGPHQPADWPVKEIGWGLLSAYTGRGYAYEAAVASITYAFDVLKWTHVHHCIEPDNLPSIRLAQRLGSTNKKLVKLPVPLHELTIHAYGQSAADWKARQLEVKSLT